MKRKREFKIPVGGSYILVIAIVFALCVFGILAIKSSGSELQKAKEARTLETEYYKADSEAEHILMQIGLILSSYHNDTSGTALKVQLQEAVGKMGMVEAKSDKVGIISYAVRVGGHRWLRIKIGYNMEPDSLKQWDIIEWKLE